MGKIPGLNTLALVVTSIAIWGTRKIIERSLEQATKKLNYKVKSEMKKHSKTTENISNTFKELVQPHRANLGWLASWILAK